MTPNTKLGAAYPIIELWVCAAPVFVGLPKFFKQPNGNFKLSCLILESLRVPLREQSYRLNPIRPKRPSLRGLQLGLQLIQQILSRIHRA